MTIINDRKSAKVSFKEVEKGEVFFDPIAKKYFIRIEGFYDENEEFYNAVELCNGDLGNFDALENIEKVNAELHISNY